MSGRRGQQVYDWWSRHGGVLDRLYDLVFLGTQARLRARSIAALELSTGDTVLELGCGDGRSLHRLRTRVGPEGRVLALDYSEGMVRRARERVREAGWANVHVLRADASHPPVAGPVDAVYASMAVSAMPDPEAVAREARRLLRPDGRMAVLDARPFGEPWTPLNRVVVPVSRWATNWNPEADVPGAMAATFGEVDLETHVWGTVFVASARAGAGADGPREQAATGR